MAENKTKQSLSLENRELFSINGVSDLVGFDENQVTFEMESTTLTVTGEGLTVTKLTLESGEATVKGKVDAIIYTDVKPKKTLISRFFK